MLVCRLVLLYFFCFFKQKTAYEMRISDWSSDVCSSDLADRLERGVRCRRQRIVGARRQLDDVIVEILAAVIGAVAIEIGEDREAIGDGKAHPRGNLRRLADARFGARALVACKRERIVAQINRQSTRLTSRHYR